MEEISIHNTAREVLCTEDEVNSLGLEHLTFTASDGGRLPYCRLRFDDGSSAKPALIVFLHGVGSVGDDNWKQMRIPGSPFLSYLRKHPHKCVVLFPQCAAGSQWVDVPWNLTAHDMPEKPSKFMAMLLELLDNHLASFDFDRARIYAGGISMGGFGAWDLVCRRPNLFSKVVSICGGADIKQADKLNGLSVYMIHGSDDRAVSVNYSRTMENALKAVGNRRVIYREIPGLKHNAWDPFFDSDDGLDWLFGAN